MRILALDVGEKRIGVALSDPLKIVAQGIETIKREDIASDIKRITSLINEFNVKKVIIGLPLNMDGTKGSGVKLIEEFARVLEKETHAEIELLDERLTTKQGERMLLDADISRGKRKQAIDKIAAQLILQNYLDRCPEK